MTETLSSIFQRTQGAPTKVAGRLVQPIVQQTIKAGRTHFVVRRIRSAEQPVPGLRLKVVKGVLEIDNQRYTEIILWADTSPESVSFCVVSKSACQLKIWNVWRANDIVQAWVGNAGIVMTEARGITTLECSGGTDDIDFSTLVVHVESAD